MFYFKILTDLLYKLEDPDNPLLGPNIKVLKFWGLLLPKNKLSKYLIIFLNTAVVLCIMTEYIDIWVSRNDLDTVLENLKSTVGATSCVFKAITMFMWQKDWLLIIDYVIRTDKSQRIKNNIHNNIIIRKFTKYCRRFTYIYCGVCILTGMVVISQPLLKYVLLSGYRDNVKNGTENYAEVFRSWVPFDKTKLKGYIVSTLYQCYAVTYGVGWVMSYDTIAVVVLVFFRVEIELLRNDCRDIFGSCAALVDDGEAFNRLKECHKRHKDLIRYTKLFNSCLSPVMLLYIIVCSLWLCIAAYHLSGETSTVQRLLLSEYIMFAALQLVLFCWHSHAVTYMSKELLLGPYESNWCTGSVSRQIDICILIHQFKRNIVFTAGPLMNLSMPLFINIMKGAYSYYTILNQARN